MHSVEHGVVDHSDQLFDLLRHRANVTLVATERDTNACAPTRHLSPWRDRPTRLSQQLLNQLESIVINPVRLNRLDGKSVCRVGRNVDAFSAYGNAAMEPSSHPQEPKLPV